MKERAYKNVEYERYFIARYVYTRTSIAKRKVNEFEEKEALKRYAEKMEKPDITVAKISFK